MIYSNTWENLMNNLIRVLIYSRLSVRESLTREKKAYQKEGERKKGMVDFVPAFVCVCVTAVYSLKVVDLGGSKSIIHLWFDPTVDQIWLWILSSLWAVTLAMTWCNQQKRALSLLHWISIMHSQSGIGISTSPNDRQIEVRGWDAF